MTMKIKNQLIAKNKNNVIDHQRDVQYGCNKREHEMLGTSEKNQVKEYCDTKYKEEYLVQR